MYSKFSSLNTGLLMYVVVSKRKYLATKLKETCFRLINIILLKHYTSFTVLF